MHPRDTGALDRLFPFLVFLMASALALVMVSDADTFFHLATGKLIWASGRLPSTNTFASVWGDYPWKNPEWLFDLILYAWHSAGGFPAVSLLGALLVGAAFALSWDTVRLRLGGTGYREGILLVPLFLLAIVASRFRFMPRPHLLTFLGLALLLNLWARKPRHLPLWFALIGFLWGNMHPGVVFGLAVCLALVASESLKGKAGTAFSIRCAAAFFLGSLANPYLAYPYAYALTTADLDRILMVGELIPPSFRTHTIFLLLAVLAAAALPSRLGKKDYLYLFLLILFLPLALRYTRFIPKFILVVLPGLCQTAGEFFPLLATRDSRRAPAVLVLVLLSALAAVLAVRQVIFLPHRFTPGWGLDESKVPSGAADLILARSLQGRLYNDYDTGGYLLWRLYPVQKVFLDGRAHAYPPSLFRELAPLQSKDQTSALVWSSLVKKYGLESALFTRGPHRDMLNRGGIFDGLGWDLVYLDGKSMVFVNPDSSDGEKVRDLVFRVVRPWGDMNRMMRIAMDQPRKVLGELGRIDPQGLQDVNEIGRYGLLAFAARDLLMAERFFRTALARAPDNPGLTCYLSDVFAAQGRKEEAAAGYRKVMKTGGRQWAGLANQRLKELRR